MKILVALTFMLGIFVAPAYAQKGGVSFNGNIFDAPPEPGAGSTQELCGILGDEAIRRRGVPALR
jgi:hypothetical protein